ncbi:MAG: lysostaphin resistance A-like protein [Paracoccaceae bacterium]
MASLTICIAIWVIFTKTIKILFFSHLGNSALATGNSPAGMIYILSSFLGLMFALLLVAKLHNRSFKSFFGSSCGFINYFAYSFLYCVIYCSIFTVTITMITGNIVTQNLSVSNWSMYLIIALPLLFIQVTAEELFFRGYLVQQLATRYNSTLIWMVLPSIGFGLAHYDPQNYGKASLLIVGILTVYGMVAIDLTRRTGNIAAAIGIHLSNNIFTILILGNTSKFSGLSLFIVPTFLENEENLKVILISEFLFIILVWYTLVRSFRGL